MYRRTETRPIYVGGIQIGGQQKCILQSMTNVPAKNVDAAVRQINELAENGCEIVRTAVLDEEDAKFHFYLPGRLLGDLPEPSYTLKSSSGDDETDEPEMVFLGWYTQRKGGTLISPDHVVDANLKLYAHWAVGEADVSGWNESLYEDAGDFNPLQAHLYEGYLYESAGSNDCRVVGLVTLKVAKETYDRAREIRVDFRDQPSPRGRARFDLIRLQIVKFHTDSLSGLTVDGFFN